MLCSSETISLVKISTSNISEDMPDSSLFSAICCMYFAARWFGCSSLVSVFITSITVWMSYKLKVSRKPDLLKTCVLLCLQYFHKYMALCFCFRLLQSCCFISMQLGRWDNFNFFKGYTQAKFAEKLD